MKEVRRYSQVIIRVIHLRGIHWELNRHDPRSWLATLIYIRDDGSRASDRGVVALLD